MTRFATIGVLLLLGGCSLTDPYQRPGMWQPNGANTLNLAAMIANPNDLIRGRGTVGTPGIEAAPPIARLWSGRPLELPSTSSQATSAGQGRPGGGGGGGGGSGAAAGAN